MSKKEVWEHFSLYGWQESAHDSMSVVSDSNAAQCSCSCRNLQTPLLQPSIAVVLTLAYQSLGVVYGDLSVSPLYVFQSTFLGDLRNSVTDEYIYGVLSLIFWTLTLIPLIKYVIIVLSADDNGEGTHPCFKAFSRSTFDQVFCMHMNHFKKFCRRWYICAIFVALPACKIELDPQPAICGHGTFNLQARRAAGDTAG